MKYLIYMLIFLTSSSVFAKTYYTISEGRWHKSKGSEISLEMANKDDKLTVNIDYKINCRGFGCLLSGSKSGEYQQQIPRIFETEEGYLDLETLGVLNFGKYTLSHQGRVTIGRYTDCHKVLISEKKKRKGMVVYYHPQVPDSGWAQVEIRILRPVTYYVMLKLKDD